MNDSSDQNRQIPSDDDRDRNLLLGIAAREPEALKGLYECRGGILFALCIRILKDRMAAEEALEDIFFEVWVRADRFDAVRGTPISYLLNLAHSRAIDKLRGRARLGRIELSTDRSAGDSSGNSFPTSAHETNTPMLLALDAERREKIRRAVGQLNPDQRQVVEMAFFDGLTHSEIAKQLVIPLGTIKTRIRQGLVHLKEALGRHFDEGPSDAQPGETSR